MNAAQVTEAEICRLVAKVVSKKVAKNGITPDMTLSGDLGVDSLGLMSLVFLVEEELGVDAFSKVEQFVGAERVSDVLAIVRQS